jgi:hypothetical protein
MEPDCIWTVTVVLWKLKNEELNPKAAFGKVTLIFIVIGLTRVIVATFCVAIVID